MPLLIDFYFYYPLLIFYLWNNITSTSKVIELNVNDFLAILKKTINLIFDCNIIILYVN